MEEVARRSGVGRATLYRHFSSREELIQLIYIRALRGLGEAIEAAEPDRGSPVEALRRQIDGCLAAIGRHPMVVQNRIGSPDVQAETGRAFAPLVELIERGQKDGSVRDDLPADWLAGLIPVTCILAVAAVDREEYSLAEAPEVVAKTLFEPILS
ncbi:MAG: TetR/AcrR family transcriptional regulator [Microvirga sp.]